MKGALHFDFYHDYKAQCGREWCRHSNKAMNESGGRSQTIILQLNGREFARAVYKANNEETQRVGVRLAGVKA